MDRLSALFRLYYNKTASPKEREEFMGLVQAASSSDLATLANLIRESGESLDSYDTGLSPEKASAILSSILGKPTLPDRQAGGVLQPPETLPRVHRIHFRRSRWWAAAAAILVIVGGGYFLINSKKSSPTEMANLPQEQRYKNDISPAKEQVIITLADGSTMVLDDAGIGTITTQGETAVVKNDGSVSYVTTNSATVLYNTIATGKGKTLNLKLADGTEVWLDAQSSIYFPTAFPGSDRVVEIKGQAYFEVAKNVAKPFKVRAAGQEIEVIGTHFNVNAHNGFTTTLLEGSVILRSAQDDKGVILKPGQQAGVDKKIVNADLDEVMAWKNGLFQFNESSVEEIMAQLSRWYDIEVVYKDKINKAFVAKISRDMPVSKLLGLLEMTKQIKFVIEGNKVTVMKW